MWYDYPLNQRNRATEKAAGVVVGGNRQAGKVGQNLKKG